MSTPSCKIVVIGDSGVGKSSLVRTYLLNLKFSFPRTYDFERMEPTIGAAYYIVQLDEVKLQIWDTAGQERFRSMCPIYFRASSGCICVFDVTNRTSFENIDSWISSFRKHASIRHINASSHLNILLVANKTDIKSSDWKVSIDEIFMKSESLNCPFILTSVIDMTNFVEFREYIKSKYTPINLTSYDNIIIPDKTQESSCVSNCLSIG